MKMLKSRLFAPVFIMVASLLVAGCGGGGGGSVAGGGIGGTGVTASGAITGFGSIKLNGLELDTTNATREVDGSVDISNGTNDDTVLGIGMVVTVTGTLNADGLTGTATLVSYDDDVQGPIQGQIDEVDQTKTFVVLGLQVSVNRISTVFENTDYATLTTGDLVEVSGFFDSAGTLHATRVEEKGGNRIEVKGTINNFGPLGRSFTLDVRNGAIQYTVDYSGLVLPTLLAPGDFVEVEGTLAATAITATRVERKTEGFDDVDNGSIEGIVTGFNGLGDFQVAGLDVDATAAGFSPAGLATSLADGVQVEVEGPIVNGMLQALKVESRGGDIEIGAMLESVVIDTGGFTGSIRLMLAPDSLDVLVDSRTILRDDTGAADPLTLAALIPMNDYLEVEAYRDDVSGNLIATEIQREAADDDLLQGPADSCDGVTVSILGLGFMLDDSVTGFQDENEASIGTAAAFCTQWATGGFLVKIVDRMSGSGPDGIADEAELEN